MKEDIIGLSTLMIIFGIMLILVGIYIFTGHKNELLFWRTKSSIKSMTKDYLKKVGGIIIIIGLIITIIGGILILFN